MDVALSSILNFHVFPTGRRIFTLGQLQKIATDRGLVALAERAEAAVKADRETHELEARWVVSQAAPAPPGDVDRIRLIDVRVDRKLTSIRDAAQAHLNGADEGDQEHIAQIENMLLSLFPAGVRTVTQLPYLDELGAVDRILTKLQGPFSGLVSELGMGRLVKQLGSLALEYRGALTGTGASGPSFDQVRAARAEGQERLLHVVAMILGAHPTSTKEDIAGRSALLAPVLKQNEAIRQYLRSRRAVEDVFPDTGEIDPSSPSGDAQR